VKLLLDTHIWLWSLLEPERLTPRVARQLTAPANELWLSPISTWEAMLLIRAGRVESPDDPRRTVERLLAAIPAREAPLTHEVAVESVLIELPHRDPADRFLAATARVFDLTLVTADDRLLGSPGFAVLPNR
jgi:PIN domain nuclease of toxin-antitoxin system